MKASDKNNQDTKWVFLKKGSCSRTMFYILNREFDHPLEIEEQAADVLAGGILQQGYQCGLLFGTVFAMGARAYQEETHENKRTALAIQSSQALLKSFISIANSDNCQDITDTDFQKKKEFAKYMISGKFISCLKLADRWAPVAIKAAIDAFNYDSSTLDEKALSCTSILAKKWGASEKKISIVAGLAGGLGLSGNACGALSTLIWLKTLAQIKETGKAAYNDPKLLKLVEDFLKETNFEFECKDICGKQFESIQDHRQYLENGGCESLINRLSSL